jgi:drug/metabolite transporter (DMT)-like permease
MAVAILATALAAWEPGDRRLADGAALGLAAALAFGVFFVALGEASEEGGVAAVVLARTASVGLLVIVAAVLRPALRVEAPIRGAVAALGALDLLANLAFSVAAARGADAPVAVLASVYPLTTVLLARTLLGERLGRVRLLGVTGVLGGVALISLGAEV